MVQKLTSSALSFPVRELPFDCTEVPLKKLSLDVQILGEGTSPLLFITRHGRQFRLINTYFLDSQSSFKDCDFDVRKFEQIDVES